MNKIDNLAKSLAVFGTLFVIIPVIAPIVFSVIFLVSRGFYQIDYLMPAELFPAVLIGSGLLIWAAVRARLRRGLIIASFVVGIIMLFGGQLLAVATGLASGATEPTGFWWAFTLGTIIVFDLAVLATGIGGILLTIDLFKRSLPNITNQ